MKTSCYRVMLAVVCAVAMGPAAMAAVQFEIGDNGPTGNHWTLGSGWGTGSGQLDAVFNVSATLPSEAFLLNVGETYSFNYGTVQLRETYIDLNETNNLGVTAWLQFDLPPVGGQPVEGLGIAIIGSVDDWLIQWPDLTIQFCPTYVDIDDCGTFKVELSDLCFDRCETLEVTACVTLCSDPCPVPEPATVVIWSLLGGVGLAMGLYRRRKIA